MTGIVKWLPQNYLIKNYRFFLMHLNITFGWIRNVHKELPSLKAMVVAAVERPEHCMKT